MKGQVGSILILVHFQNQVYDKECEVWDGTCESDKEEAKLAEEKKGEMGVPYGSMKNPVPAATSAAIAWVLVLVLQLSQRLLLACLSYSETRDHPRAVYQSVSAAEVVKIKLLLIQYNRVRFKGQDADEENDNVCSICLCCMRRGPLIKKPSNCRHIFHAGCLDQWVERLQVNCPNCRALM